MADHAEEVRKYVDSPNQDAIDEITRYCGIALRNRDSSYVSAGDRKELDTVRDGFAKKKLGLDPETADAGIDKVCERMKGGGSKGRVAFYYLLAEETGTLDKLN